MKFIRPANPARVLAVAVICVVVLCVLFSRGKPKAGSGGPGVEPAIAEVEKKAKPDEALFLLYKVDSFYRNWPDFQKNPGYFEEWYGVSREQLVAFGKRAWEVDESVAVLYESGIELLDRYKIFMESNHLVKEAAKQQRESDSFWLGVELQLEGAAMKSGHYAATIGGALLTLIRSGMEENRLSKAEAEIAKRQLDALRGEFDTRLESMRRVATNLAERRNWAPEDSNFEDASVGREKDPFVMMERILKKENDPTSDYESVANDCLMAHAQVPEDGTYQRMRAQLLIKALDCANSSCRQQTGGCYSNGPAKNAEFASKVCASALQEAGGMEDLERRVAVETVRVLAFQGKFREARDRAMSIDWMSSDPVFLLRKACLQSLCGEPAVARETLREGLRAGYSEIASLRSHKDLEAVRLDDPEGFQTMLTPTIRPKTVWDMAEHEVELTNTSLFPLTNVKYTIVVLWNNGAREQYHKTVPIIKGGETIVWKDAFSTWTFPGGIEKTGFQCDQF